MTESTPFFCDRAAEIIAAYGGDTSRWPDAERATAMSVIAADPDLTAALAEARMLDYDLTGWARRPLRGNMTAAGIAAAAVAMRGSRHVMRWAAGGSIAASLAAALLLLSPAPITPSTAGSGGVKSVAISDETAFAQVFTPTPDEEHIL